MNLVIKVLGITAFLGLGALNAQIEKVLWFPESPIHMGKGVTKAFPLTAHFSCMDAKLDEFTSIDSKNSVETSMFIRLVTNTKEMHTMLGLSATLSAHATFLNQSPLSALTGSASYKQSKEINETSIALVIVANADFGSFKLKSNEDGNPNVSLRPEFQYMLENKQYGEFLKKCGTHFVEKQRRKGFVMAVLNFSNLTKEQKKELSASLTLGDGTIPTKPETEETDPEAKPPKETKDSVTYKVPVTRSLITPSSVSLGIDQFLKQVKKYDATIDIKFITRGGGGLGSQTDIFKEPNIENDSITFKGLMALMSQYLESFKRDPSDLSMPGAPAEYFLFSYELYGLPASRIVEIDNDLLQEIYYLYLAGESNRGLIESKIEELDPINSEKAYLKATKIKTSFDNYLNKLWQFAQKILKKQPVNMTEIPAAPKYNLREIGLVFDIANSSFVCESVNGVACGVKADLWNINNQWNSSFVISGNLGVIDHLKQLTLKQLGVKGEVVHTVLTINPGEDLGYASIKPDGSFSLKFGKLTQINNYSLYQQFRKTSPVFEVILLDKDGTERKYIVQNFSLVGKHLNDPTVKSLAKNLAKNSARLR